MGRYVTRPFGPLVAGAALQVALGLPFVLAGRIKSAYDLTLWSWFRRVPAPTSAVLAALPPRPHPCGRSEYVIVCLRTVRIPPDARERFLAWINENQALREEHGILFEFVLERSSRQSPAKALQAAEPSGDGVDEAVVLTGWGSHDAFDAWIDTPDRDRLTASPSHNAVEYRPITRYDVVSGYVNLDGLSAVAESPKEEP